MFLGTSEILPSTSAFCTEKNFFCVFLCSGTLVSWRTETTFLWRYGAFRRFGGHAPCFVLLVVRAPRFPLQLSVRYRTVVDREWRRGETENISHSGVLLRTPEALDVNTIVELRVHLTMPNPGSEAAEVSCLGRVVRTIPPCPTRAWAGCAVAIERYDFVPPPIGFAIDQHP
jgi:PilZ domain